MTKETKNYILTKELLHTSRLLGIVGEETRMRIMCFMFDNKKACVSDIANALNISVANTSHHLQIMRDNGLFETEKMGNHVCYILVNDSFTKKIKSIVCS